MKTVSIKPTRKRWWRRWGRWGLWAFIAVNVGGLFLILPLLKAVFPLIGIWWHTHSLANFKTHQQNSAQSALVASRNPADEPGPRTTGPAVDTGQAFDTLTNQLQVIDKLSSQDLNRIVAARFGAKKAPVGDPKKFDEGSAVFDTISSTNLVLEGKTYYCYRVDLVDQNGNHKVNYDYFNEPNLEYERSKATMELVNRTPQLKKIYDVMSYILAEKSSAATNAPVSANDLPAFRVENEPDAKQP
jgi:hypothetical protein